MPSIDAETLLPNDRLREKAAAGEATQIHRGRPYADEGDTFVVDGEEFVVTTIEERTLGDLTDEDARKEGYRDIEQYREILTRVHENFEWDDDSTVVRHAFEPRDD